MVINEHNSAINSFTKGMNSDGAYDQLDGAQYTFAQNVRITKNQFLGGKDDYASVHEGIIAPVPSGLNLSSLGSNVGRILAIRSIDNIAILVTVKSTTMYIYRFDLDETTNQVTSDIREIWHGKVWDSGEEVPQQVSTVLYKELQNVIKLYIATGKHPIMCMRVDDSIFNDEGESKILNRDIDDFMSNRIVPTKRIVIEGTTSGRLLTSQVQYTYRYYNKYGNLTQLAPLTNKIQVIDPSRSKEIGNAENTETSLGFILSIDTAEYNSKFDRIQVYRLQYIKAGEDAEVSMIYDGELKQTANKFVFNDVGIDPIQSLTIEEFSALSGIIVIPQVIEQNQEYMFCGNIKDDTIITDAYIPSTYKNGITLTETRVCLSRQGNVGQIPSPGNILYDGQYDYNLLINNTGDSSEYVTTTVTDYLQQRGINPKGVKASYQDIMTSSLLRSLRRGETYKYAIVFYDKYGRRTDVLPLGDIPVPEYGASGLNRPFTYSNGDVVAHPYGVNIKIPQIVNKSGQLLKDIIGCQIVRRSSADIYQNTLLQVALSRPVQQGLLDINVDSWSTIKEETVKKSPFYPTGFMSVNNIRITPTFYLNAFPTDRPTMEYRPDLTQQGKDALDTRTKNRQLYQIFSSEIDFRRDDVLSRVNTSDTKIKELLYIPAVFSTYKNNQRQTTYEQSLPVAYSMSGETVLIDRNKLDKLNKADKQSFHTIFNFYNTALASTSGFGEQDVNAIKDVKMADWDSGFTNITRSGDEQNVFDAIKKYKSYSTNIDSYSYNNWVSFAKYDLDPGESKSPNMLTGDEIIDSSTEHQEILGTSGSYTYWLDGEDKDRYDMSLRKGTIGPGPSCFLLTTKNDSGGSFQSQGNRFSTCICNIKHTPKTLEIKSEEYEQYFGFGNYFNLKYNGNELVTEDNKRYLTVFDGDIYITPHEFTTMYKTYNFESVDTLQSTQITNYIPLESKVNTFFDYGMNLMNTQSENLLFEPGSIEGVTTQERPCHQYNMIYSDNDASNDVFTMISTDKNETNNFKQRTFYSEVKNNGEFIDNFLIYKAAAFIDVDSKYGKITNLMTDRNTLYYWQDTACGKFSVNERSLINDQNSNTIMLGQSGILSRYDYLTTKYGMRDKDFCAISADNGVYWIDINNKAIVLLRDQVVNYGEQLNVQNIINDYIVGDSNHTPKINYDLQNNELLCKCLEDGKQLVFNTKYNVATSIYTRDYDSILDIKNHQYGLKNTNTLHITKYNYLPYDNYTYLAPLKLEFIVNPSASVTKVFDSQQIIPIKRDSYTNSAQIMNGVQMAFETDIVSRSLADKEPYTDREGNIIYNIPRHTNELGYGCRIRGKWMRVEINNNSPIELFTLSHVITKFRQSFS